MHIFTKKSSQKAILPYVGQGEYYGRPGQAWTMVLCFFVIACIVVAVFSTRVFFRIQREELYHDVANDQKPISGIRVGQMDKVIQYLERKEARFQEIMTAPDKMIDPSL